ERAEREIYDGASRAELDRALAMAARVLIETDPIYNQVLVRMDLDVYYAQVLGDDAPLDRRGQMLQDAFPRLLKAGVN
ncbi:hypothetical protein ABTK22_19710, partial [Acinetobacter baumannii]